MGKDKEKDKERDKDKKKDKKEKKKDKSHKEKSSRHKHHHRHASGGSDEEKHSKHHSRSTDRGTSPSSSKDKRDKDRHREEKLKRSGSPDVHEEEVILSKRPHIEKEDVHVPDGEEGERGEGEREGGTGGAGAGLELSIEETNKLRLELGLKPLQMDNKPKENKKGEEALEMEEEEEEEYSKKKDVHVPAKNIGDIKKAEKIREKIEMMRESRGLARKLVTVKGLGEDEGESSGSASDWVKKMRDKEKEKKLAEERARYLEEMDNEANDENEEEEKERKTKDVYSSRHLAGLTIEHKEDRFQDGRDVILTLKDTKILDNEDDVLVNVNMVDDEKGLRNIESKKNLPGYQPYEEEFDEYGNPITRSLLYKYDEEIEGQKVNKFVLGDSGDYKVSELQKEKEKSRQMLQQKAITLDIPELSVASEYYTSEEMVQFRKRKKRKKKEKFKVEDLVSLDSQENSGRDHGTRHKEEEPMDESVPMETDIKPDHSLLDENDSKVDTALERTRRLLSRNRDGSSQSTGAAHVASMLIPNVKIKTENNEDEERKESADDGLIIIDTTSEFCRQIGEEDSTVDKVDIKEEKDNFEAMDESELGGWAEIDPNKKEDEALPEKPDVLELEAKTHLTGVAAALQMATKKGFIDVERENVVKRKGDSKTIIHGLGTRDWEYERDRGRERDRDKDNHGREISFCEKKDYIPDVKIEYVDDKGRLLTAKEAFRHMSHKFHGKGSGKKKTDKLIKRRKEEILLSKADAGDTPLQSLEMLRKKQEFSQSAYVVLTGQQQQTLQTTELAKRK